MGAPDRGGGPVAVVCGPTAAGKSEVAMYLAERRPATLVVADSRQVYRGFDVGTAKPDAAARARVPHCGLDLVDPTERYSASAWSDAADRWIDEARAAQRRAIVVGGTGFYIAALMAPLFAAPPLDALRRARLGAVLAKRPRAELVRWTETLDPARAHLGRAQLLRAIETVLLAGERLSTLQRRHARPPRRTARYLLVDPGAALAARIERRLDAMLAGGWPDEVRALAARVDPTAPAWKASGYGALGRAVAGESTMRDARERILIETRQYAKRQRTWFRHQLPVEDVTLLDPTAADWERRAAEWIDRIDERGGEERR